ncbi:sigma-70 family RNA polymerase sigma factor [Flavobacteriaceae bacterium S356]|uniref:RNA polymerase sigma factor n=1 Tax=Asprobacillus argus TaxID=3076534 RepID=A0ABU3LIH4_9FLAO|nr:sigma-70 family RNA polymerase sigma factor [Flavobacteriaceae bacterium S356]
MTINNDQQYIDKVLNGDTNAFAFLVDKYRDMVFSLALKITKRKEEAEEVAQDSFIKAFKSLQHFKGDSKFSTWLYKITYNNCIDRVKKIARTHNTDTIDEVNENKIKAIEDTLQVIERGERAEMIKECMDALPEDERTILWLFYFEELSLKEIKDVTSYSESNIKVKLHRARKRLLAIVKARVEPELINHYGR